MNHALIIFFVFAFGACVGSFLNVVVWRLPRGESLVSPPSHCPKCNTRLAWYDNVPVFGWLALRGKCRYCKEPISARYPIVEAITGLLFVLYYVAFFIFQLGPCGVRPLEITQDWPMYALYMAMVAALLASSLIDAEMMIIPIEIPWFVAAVALVMHAVIDLPSTPGALNVDPLLGAMSAGCGIGLLISILLLRKKLIAQSFAEGGPLLEFEKQEIEKQTQLAIKEGRKPDEHPIVEFTRAQIREEMGKEMLFLIPPLLLGGLWMLLCWKVPFIGSIWRGWMHYHPVSGFLGALWGALVGAFVIWLTRILGSIAFGREAMGLGDVHLMFGIGAVIGALGSVIVFFLAPFCGLLYALYKLITRSGRELSYGPWLSLAAAVVVLFYCRIFDYLSPSLQGLMFTFGPGR